MQDGVFDRRFSILTLDLKVLLGLCISDVRAVVLALDLLDENFHLLGLALPLLLGHLLLALEELLVGLAVAPAEPVPQRGVLTIVVIEVQMVHGVACGAVDDGTVRHVFTVMYQNGPDVDDHEEQDRGNLLQRQDEWEDVVWQTLCPAVERVEGVRGIGRRHDPFVMRLVQALVEDGVVQAAVDPVDEEVGEAEEEEVLQDIIRCKRCLFEGVVQLAVSADFEQEEGHGEDGHDWQCADGLLDLEPDLVLEVLWVLEGGFVENKDIGQRREDEVEDYAEDPAQLKVR